MNCGGICYLVAAVAGATAQNDIDTQGDTDTWGGRVCKKNDADVIEFQNNCLYLWVENNDQQLIKQIQNINL